jgi:prevent-host-death family protein
VIEMPFIGIRDLSRQTSRVIKEFEATGEPVVVTREGRPIGALMPISEAQLQDLALATAPQFRAPSASPGGSGESGSPGATRSLREAAAERGIELEGDPAEVDIDGIVFEEELPVDAAEVQLGSIVTILRPRLAGQVVHAAAAEIEAANREALAAADAGEAEQGEVREVTDATAELYGQLFRRHLREALEHEEAPAALLGASHSAGRALREMNKSIIEAPRFSFHNYAAMMRAVATVSEWRAMVEEEQEAPAAEAAESAP